MTAAIRKHLAENPGDFDPRQYLTPAREELKKMYIHKCKDVLGSAGHALDQTTVKINLRRNNTANLRLIRYL